MLVAVWHMLTNDTDWTDLGGDFFTRPDTQRRTHQLVAQLQAHGHDVTLTPAA